MTLMFTPRGRFVFPDNRPPAAWSAWADTHATKMVDGGEELGCKPLDALWREQEVHLTPILRIKNLNKEETPVIEYCVTVGDLGGPKHHPSHGCLLIMRLSALLLARALRSFKRAAAETGKDGEVSVSVAA